MSNHPRVGLNAQLLSVSASYRRAGIHHYVDRLLRHLPAANGEPFEFVVFTHAGAAPGVAGLRVRATRWPTHRPAVRIAWEQCIQPVWVGLEGVQLLHSLAFVAPLLCPCPSVVTVYDLSFVHFPHLFRGVQAAYLRLFTRLSCRAARRVIAISDSTRSDIARLYGVPAGRIDLARPGIDPTYQPLPPAQVEAFRRQRGLPGTFILHVGSLEPRKNHLGLLDAFARLVHAQPPGLKLVCAGGPGWFYKDIYAAVERLNLQGRVIFAGYVPADELPLWYNACSLFVYPSLYEGFGLPVLEAMACGAPVVTSNTSSLPEAGGDAALLVAPHDVAGLADAMRRVLSSPDLRRHLSQAGRAQAARFTWQQTAQQTLATYQAILSPRKAQAESV